MISKIKNWLWRELFTITLPEAAHRLYVLSYGEMHEGFWMRRNAESQSGTYGDDQLWNCLGQTIIMNMPYLARNVKTRLYENIGHYDDEYGWCSCMPSHCIVWGAANQILHLSPRRVTHDDIRVDRKRLKILFESFGA